MEVVGCTDGGFVLVLENKVLEWRASLLEHGLIMHLHIGLEFVAIIFIVPTAVIFSDLLIANAAPHFERSNQ